ncbi:MAG: L-threonylcarbamoyladenylate synthase [Chthoniobacterales bacterium]
MITRVRPARGEGEIPAAVAEAADFLQRGALVAVPTETVYGLACDALDAGAAARVFAAKERPSFDPLIVHVAGASWIPRLSSADGPVLALAQELAATFWPGPLTLVLPSRDEVPDLVRSGLPTVALRCSAHAVMSALLAVLNRPLAAPSANRFGRISPVTAEHVVEELGGRIPLVLDGGSCAHGLESTIVAVEDGRLTILRPGPVTKEQLAPFAAVSAAVRGSAVAAPGMLASHYAPRTPLRLLAAGETAGEVEGCGLLAFGPGTASGFFAVERLSSDQAEAAREFFAALRRLDAAGLRCIYAQSIPESGLGLAIMDRLRRAAHG